mmetsp:Transcript_8290/g.19220  ORF Transcript_8290/g.19220 Transcript_8290/m.19220 type:complete len:220 (+) Transcript_8290:511-1170(+)
MHGRYMLYLGDLERRNRLHIMTNMQIKSLDHSNTPTTSNDTSTTCLATPTAHFPDAGVGWEEGPTEGAFVTSVGEAVATVGWEVPPSDGPCDTGNVVCVGRVMEGNAEGKDEVTDCGAKEGAKVIKEGEAIAKEGAEVMLVPLMAPSTGMTKKPSANSPKLPSLKNRSCSPGTVPREIPKEPLPNAQQIPSKPMSPNCTVRLTPGRSIRISVTFMFGTV